MLVDSMDIDMPVFVVREAPSWVEPIKEFLINGTLSIDENESRRIQRRSKAYTIINGEVYKRSVTGVLQRCVEPEEGKEMLEEIHRGECGHHASSRALVAKVFRHGFYWPTALDNAEDLVRKCNGCQRYAKQNHTPSGLKTIPLTWPFAVWCLDMVGPFKTARGNMTHILVMVDKFTKWLEVKPIAKCDGHTAVKFLKDVILRYGYPHSIITDNGTNFAQGEFKRFCESKNIRLDLCSVAHPQGNGQVEGTNALVLSGIKPRLIDAMEKSPGCWIDELPSVLWSLRTTPNRSTGYTPFFMVYGAEAVIPTDILHDSPRVQLYTEEEVKEARENDVDLLEEARELALARTAIYQQNLRRYHSRKVNPRVFREGDLVLRLCEAAQAVPSMGKDLIVKSGSRESGSRSFRGSIASISIVQGLLLGFISFLVKKILDAMGRRDEGAHFGVLRDPYAIPWRQGSGPDRFRAFAHADEGIQVELRVPRAGERRSGANSAPFADPRRRP
ncbi:hypothetical protein QYE76_065846 [Lolium multiflorum]|uniref:Integrase catalytic domain-containing protein n=1 Tax=Lolium multiflorum TaxID=4521 RepID=A0AAD8SAV9_LOLMU|nr:hypothetical protein QYE76_065846 [Lolium multiflorum]